MTDGDLLESERGRTAGEGFEYHELGAAGHGSAGQEQKVRTSGLLGSFLDDQL